MRPDHVKPSVYIDFNKKNYNKEDPKFKVGDHVKISKHKNIPAKFYVPNLSELILWLKKLEIQCHGLILLLILKKKKFLERFMKKKNCQNQIKKSLEFEKVIKIKRDKLYVTLKGCNISFNSWIDKKT